MSSAAFQSIFQLLKVNKEFPNYQAERRIDIFINYFLDRMLTSFLKEKTTFVCPEFPLKISGSNRSTKLDYLCKTKRQPVFVELKTSVTSLKETQAIGYTKCNWKTCVDELKQIRNATKPVYRSKYDSLIAQVERIKVNAQNSAIRIIYITPLNKEGKTGWSKVSISEPVKISELNVDIKVGEKIIWDFLLELDLYIFEIVKKI